MYNSPLLDLFLGIPSNHSYPAVSTQVLLYDTTFNLGDLPICDALLSHWVQSTTIHSFGLSSARE